MILLPRTYSVTSEDLLSQKDLLAPRDASTVIKYFAGDTEAVGKNPYFSLKYYLIILVFIKLPGAMITVL